MKIYLFKAFILLCTILPLSAFSGEPCSKKLMKLLSEVKKNQSRNIAAVDSEYLETINDYIEKEPNAERLRVLSKHLLKSSQKPTNDYDKDVTALAIYIKGGFDIIKLEEGCLYSDSALRDLIDKFSK
jgi:hypothetical protein